MASSATSTRPRVDIGILTVIPPELDAAEGVLGPLERERESPADTIYLRGSVHSLLRRRDYSVVLAGIGAAGNPASSALATQMVERYHPQVMLLMGIAAGIRGKVRIGEVVLSERVVAYELEALTVGKDGISSVEHRPENTRVSHGIQQDVTHYRPDPARLDGWFRQVGGQLPTAPRGKKKEWGDHVVSTLSCKTHVTIASGEKLLRNPDKLRAIRNSHGKVEVGEMEAAGLVEACRLRNIGWLVIRGISDFGDEFKDDRFHALASKAAAAVMRDFIAYGLDLGASTQEDKGGGPILDRSRTSARMTSGDRGVLTIGLAVQQDALVRRYYFENGESFEARPQRWVDIGAGVRLGGRRGIDGLRYLLVDAGEDEVRRELQDDQRKRACAALFEILFGPDEATWGPILGKASGIEGAVTPHRYPLRVRLVAEDGPVHRTLLPLPWRATMWGEHVLADRGWTFELCDDRASAPDIRHNAAPSTLLLFPEGADDLGAADHLVEIKELFESIAPGYALGGLIQVVRTRDEILPLMREDPRWDLIYFFGHGGIINDRVRLKIGPAIHPADGCDIRDLARWLRRRPPRAIFLNGNLTTQGAWHGSARHLLSDVPIILANVATSGAASARLMAIRWLRAWLKDLEDPVRAAHRRPPDASLFIDWGVPLVYASYSTWSVLPGRALATPVPESAERALDRDDQRARMSKHAFDLSQHGVQRIEAAIAYGGPDDAIEHISEQLRDHIEQRDGHRLHVTPVPVDFPDVIPRDTLPYAHALLRSFGGSPGAPLKDLLNKAAPLPTPDATPILWLDWGVLRGRSGYGSLVTSWLEFLRDELAPACARARRDIRIIAFVAIEASDRVACDKLGSNLRRLEDGGTFSTGEMNYTCLPMLDNVRSSDLRKFLSARIPDRQLVEALVRVIFAKTGGRYKETIALLERGLAGEWRVLLRDLQRELGPASQLEEEW